MLSKPGSSSKTGKIFKPVMDVTEEDTKTFIDNFCSSTSPADDETLSAPKNDNVTQNGRNEDHPFSMPLLRPRHKKF